MADATTIFQAYSDYILYDATWSATVAPLTSYSVSQLTYLRPDWRIKWGVQTVTITALLGAARQGDIVAIPISNVDSATCTVTNNAGLSQVVTMNAAGPGGWPATSWIDLTSSWSVGQRTANVWNFVITSNSKTITLGSALWISGPKRTLTHGLSKQAQTTQTYARAVTTNEYLVDFVLDFPAQLTELSTTLYVTSDAERTTLRNWIDGSHGASLPALFVRDSTLNEALLCFASQAPLETRVAPKANTYKLQLHELNKGIPIT